MAPSSLDLETFQVATAELDDYRWLVSPEAEPHLARAAQHEQRSTVALLAALRKDLSPNRARLVVGQLELRERAKAKFAAADRMLFTRQLLEQATDERSAEYKASRFPRGAAVVDLCCGLGGDLLALARRGPCRGIDLHPVAALLADANCRRLECREGSAGVGDARELALDAGTCWHIDPDRRGQGTRSIQPEYWEPNAAELDQLMARHPDGAIKLAPATVLPADFAPDAELQWLGQPRSCRQQIAWLGALARHPSQHTATVLGRHTGEPAVSITGDPDGEVAPAARLGAYVHEPHAAVLASRLTGALAQTLDLHAVTPGVAYLTSDRALDDDPRLATFEVLADLPFDIKQVKAALRARKLGRLEIKHRGLQLNPELLLKRLRVPGDQRGCLIVAGGRDRTRAMITRRLPRPDATPRV